MGRGARRERIGPGRRTMLTADLQKRLCALIRSGAYQYSAAEACGINRRTFFDWIQRGEGTSNRGQLPVYAQFVRAVREAQAVCRANAEIEVRRLDPKWWLARMHRDQPGFPGWWEGPLQQRDHPRGLSIQVHR
jgi:hypothetical protein